MKQERVVAVFPSILWVFILAVSVNTMGYNNGPKQPDLESFRELARNAACADIGNRLFLIDKKLVFWDRQGNCHDNSFAQTLYGNSPEEVLCSRKDSIAGPRQSCDNEESQEMFQTMLDNLDEEDLGLGFDHQVEPISF